MKKFKQFLIEEKSLNSGEEEIPEYQKFNPNYNKSGTVLNLPFKTAAGIKLLHQVTVNGPTIVKNPTAYNDSEVHAPEFNKDTDQDEALQHKPVFNDDARGVAYGLQHFFNIGVYNPKYAENKPHLNKDYWAFRKKGLQERQQMADSQLRDTHDLVLFLAHPGHSAESLHNHFLDMMHLASQHTSPVVKQNAYDTILHFTLENPNKSAVEPLIDKLMKLAEPKLTKNEESTSSEYGIEPIKTDDSSTDALYAPQDKKTYETLFGGLNFMSVDGLLSRDKFFYRLVNSPHISGKQVKQIEDLSVDPKSGKRLEHTRMSIIGNLRKKTEIEYRDSDDWVVKRYRDIDVAEHNQRHPWLYSPEYKDLWLSERKFDNRGRLIQTQPVSYNRSDFMSKIGVPAINENHIKSLLLNLLKENNEQEDYEKNRSEMLDSIHSMPLEDAKAYAELDLVTEPSVFSANYNAINHPYRLLKQNHAFTKYLTHPKHTDESVLEDLNFLMKMAHAKDNESGPEQVYVRGRRHQADVYSFALNNFPTIAYAMGKTLFDNEPRFTTRLNREYSPIQVAPELLQNIKKQHGTIRTKATWYNHGAFLNDRGEDMWWQKNFSPLDVYDALTRIG